MRRIFFSSFVFILVEINISGCTHKLRPAAAVPSASAKTISAPEDATTGAGKYILGNFTGTLNKNIVYAHNLNKNGIDQQLDLDIYKPPNPDEIGRASCR